MIDMAGRTATSSRPAASTAPSPGATKLVVELGPGSDFTDFNTFGVAVDVEVYGEGGDDPAACVGTGATT